MGLKSNTPSSPAEASLPSFFELIDQKANGGKSATGYGDFDIPARGVALAQERGKFTSDGDFTLPDNVKQGMTNYGQELIDLAAKHNIDISKTKEFAGADFDKNGKLSAQEVGAVMMSASLDISNRGIARGNDLTFDNSISKHDTEKLLNPESKAAVMEIARQLLGDNGVKVAGDDTRSAASNQHVMDMVNTAKPDTTMRC